MVTRFAEMPVLSVVAPTPPPPPAGKFRCCPGASIQRRLSALGLAAASILVLIEDSYDLVMRDLAVFRRYSHFFPVFTSNHRELPEAIADVTTTAVATMQVLVGARAATDGRCHGCWAHTISNTAMHDLVAHDEW